MCKMCSDRFAVLTFINFFPLSGTTCHVDSGICVLQAPNFGRNAFIDYVMKCHSAESALGDFAAEWKVWLLQSTKELSDDEQEDVVYPRPWTCTAWEAQIPLTHL